MKKQMSYANTLQVPFVALVGASEMEAQRISLKDMTTGEQTSLTLEEVIEKVKG